MGRYPEKPGKKWKKQRAGIFRFMHFMLAGHELAEVGNASVHEFEI